MILKSGNKGVLVRELQESLLALGYHPGPIDGLFGGLVEEALEKFQKSKKISVDGVCGPSTFKELNDALEAKGLNIIHFSEESNTDPSSPERLLGWIACEADKIPGRGGFTRVTLRSDAASSYKALREEVVALGGVLTSAGGRRGLSSRAGPARSKKSMHYVGLALDLALPTGMQNPDTDPYLIQSDGGRRWRIWCKTDNPEVPEVIVPASYVTRHGSKTVIRVKSVSCRAFDLTSLFKKHGWERIRARRSFFKGGSYGGAEWWHFQHEAVLTPGTSTFGAELLKVYPLSQAQKFIYWDESKNCVFKKTWF